MFSKNKEIWKDIEGYEGYYQVSNLGNIRSLDRYITKFDGTLYKCKGKLMAGGLSGDGYYSVNLCKQNKQKTNKIHRLVAKAFIYNPNSLQVVNHKDFNKLNNRVENLEWCTLQENIKHCIDNNKHACQIYDRTGINNPVYGKHFNKGIKNGQSKPIRMLDKNKELIKDFGYIGDCAKFIKEKNISKATIDSICSVISNKAKDNTCYKKKYYFEFILTASVEVNKQ